jgi:phosphoglucomutase
VRQGNFDGVQYSTVGSEFDHDALRNEKMAVHALAGKPASTEMLIDTDQLIANNYDQRPDPSNAGQLVSFGTSGHRGTSSNATFTEAHIGAITQALVEHRQTCGINGPLFLGKDTHALSAPAERTSLEVLAANGIEVILQKGNGFTPTPVISHAILNYNKGRTDHLADGIVITPSHNPPEDGGFKYNPPQGGPADTEITSAVQRRANELLKRGGSGVLRMTFENAMRAPTTFPRDFSRDYIGNLKQVIDLAAIKSAQLRLGVDPLGGASVEYWPAIAETYGLNMTVVNDVVDPQFGFMTVDHDGKIRMDCSSPDAMASLVHLKDRFDLSFGNDPDADRHGIVTRSIGLMNPNHYLAVAIQFLFTNRSDWPQSAAVGKTCVSSSMIDSVTASLGRMLYEVPVGFKWFSEGLYSGSLGFGGEESAGASFLRRDGSVWSTDKDGILLALLAAEITAKTGQDPGEHYKTLVARFGERWYVRIDQPITRLEKERFQNLTPAAIPAGTLAGEVILSKISDAPGNHQAIGGVKVATANGWFAARPSGTEAIYKLYAESRRDESHLQCLISEARLMVTQALAFSGAML